MLNEEFGVLFDASGLPYYLAGIFTAWAWIRAKEFYWKMRNPNRTPPPRKTWKMIVVAMFVAGILMISTAWQTQKTSTEQRRLAYETQQLAEHACEESKVATLERGALQKVFIAIMTVPPEIDATPDDSPERAQWFAEIIAEYLAAIGDATEQRENFEAFGVTHPECELS